GAEAPAEEVATVLEQGQVGRTGEVHRRAVPEVQLDLYLGTGGGGPGDYAVLEVVVPGGPPGQFVAARITLDPPFPALAGPALADGAVDRVRSGLRSPVDRGTELEVVVPADAVRGTGLVGQRVPQHTVLPAHLGPLDADEPVDRVRPEVRVPEDVPVAERLPATAPVGVGLLVGRAAQRTVLGTHGDVLVLDGAVHQRAAMPTAGTGVGRPGHDDRPDQGEAGRDDGEKEPSDSPPPYRGLLLRHD